MIGVSKHLCGAATDLALLSVINSLDLDRLGGLMIALCCHHRCDWDLFVGKEFLQGKGFNPGEFKLMCGLTSWATCGSGKPRQRQDKQQNGNDQEEPKKEDIDSEPVAKSAKHDFRYDRLNLPRERREDIGRKTKRLLDFARVQFLKEKLKLKKAKLYYYCDPTISLENVVLLAH